MIDRNTLLCFRWRITLWFWKISIWKGNESNNRIFKLINGLYWL